MSEQPIQHPVGQPITRAASLVPPRHRGRPLVALFAALALVAGLAGTTPAASPAQPIASEIPGRPAPVDWGPCPPDPEAPAPEAMDCATLTAPLSYTHPGRGTVELALKRHRAGDPDRRRGSIFINPGGPGASGFDLVAFAPYIFSPRVLDRFDIVGFDPRGVGRSDPLLCFDSAAQSERLLGPLPAFPVTHREERGYYRTFARVARLCARNGRAVIRHMSTANVARDLDLMRAAVGDRRLTYFAGSYGSLLGVMYARLFPGRVRALVLDAMADPVLWTTGRTRSEGRRIPFSTRLGSHLASLEALQEFFRTCAEAGTPTCAFASGDPERRYARLAARLRRSPVTLPGPDGPVTFGYADLVVQTIGAMGDPYSWPFLAELLAALSAGAESPVLGAAHTALTRRLHEPDPDQAQTLEGFAGVACTDGRNPRRLADWSLAGRRADRQAAYFGRAWTWLGIPCARWPARDRDAYLGPWGSTTTAPILLVGNTLDPTTPYSGAQRVAELLPTSRLLTMDGPGHTALGLSSCVDALEDRYLRTRELPAPGTVCPPDVAPFEAPALRGAARRGRQAFREAVLATTR